MPLAAIDLSSKSQEEIETNGGKTTSRHCRRTPLPIDFVYDRETDTFSIEKFINDAQLIARI